MSAPSRRAARAAGRCTAGRREPGPLFSSRFCRVLPAVLRSSGSWGFRAVPGLAGPGAGRAAEPSHRMPPGPRHPPTGQGQGAPYRAVLTRPRGRKYTVRRDVPGGSW